MKRVLAFLCVLALVLSVAPSAAFAAETYDLQAAINAAAEEIIVLEADASNVTVNRDIIIDLNGHDLDGVTVLAGTLYCMDSATADYTVADGVYGHVTNVTGNVKAAEGYLQVGDSFHRVDLDIYAMTLRAADVGVYYKSSFAADEVVAQLVESFGVALSVVAEPNASNLESYCGYSRFTGFEAGEGANAAACSTLLKGIMKPANGDNKNAKNAALPIYGRAYIKTSEGYFFGETVNRSLQQQVEAIDGVWADLSYSQKAPVLEMLETYSFAKKNWNIPNLEGVLIPGLGSEIEVPISVNAENGVVTEETTVSAQSASVTVPAGAQLAAGANALTLTVTPKASSDTDLTPGKSEVLLPMDVHVDGVEATNTAPVLITLKACLPTGLNDGNVKLYHVENGLTVEMTRVAAPANHNEFSYDPLTGDVVLAMASFSEVTMLADADNTWDGSAATAFAGGSGTEADPYLIANANQLAYFRNLVDAGVTYKDQFVKLTADINLDGVNFDPIGYGYECDKYMTDGMTFNGTFDGGEHTISGLYQNGWDLDVEKYSYSMAGGGLFASVVDATIKNVNIYNANIVMECVDMGILVGYSQGNCTYENIEIHASKIANYQRATGGVVGEVSPRRNADGSLMFESNTHTFKDILVSPNVVVGSLWGDFDAPCGGVIGGRWDDNNSTLVVMNNVFVACRLDVYNDVTSAYQWHAYRRAGMLIGNTDTPAADGRKAQVATADFLTCTDVTVKLGSWANYHYCRFTNEQNPGRNYPWVRVEAGENCSAYSNPRYGQPTDAADNQVTSETHEHQETDKAYHNVQISFAQLYGGGQGVYGATEHEGVTIENFAYTITYVYNGKLLYVRYVTAEENESDVSAAHNQAESNLKNVEKDKELDYWVDAGSNKVTTIPAGNENDIVLYPSFLNWYTALFVDQKGNVIYQEAFTNQTAALNEPDVPAVEGGFTGAWSTYDLKTATGDITIYPIYNADDGIISLTPVDSDGDGVTNYYAVTNVKEHDENIHIVIPDSLNGIPVKDISGNAFAEFDNITTVRVPISITYIGADAFANQENSGFLGALKYEQITFLYEGTYEQWQAIEKDANWDRYVGQNSRIYFLEDGTYSTETASNGVWSATDRVWSDPVAGTYEG